MGSTAMMFKALADENRLLLLRLLLRRNCCVRALARQLDISEAAVSQHLKVLREAGLIFGEKCGYFMHYTVHGVFCRADALHTAAWRVQPCGI